MKKGIVMCFSLVMMVLLLTACGSNEVDSRDEANRVLLSANSVIAECEKSMDDFETLEFLNAYFPIPITVYWLLIKLGITTESSEESYPVIIHVLSLLLTSYWNTPL